MPEISEAIHCPLRAKMTTEQPGRPSKEETGDIVTINQGAAAEVDAKPDD